MSRSFAAAMRRMNRLMRPSSKQARSVRKLQKAMAGAMVEAALAPLAVKTPKQAKRRKARKRPVGRSLGTVVKQLQAAQSLVPGASSRTARRAAVPRVPKGAQYLARTHRGAAGSRSYKLYLPASQPKRPRGLILMLHGCNQTPDDFALGTHMNAMAEKHGLAVAYPAQTSHHNAASCWSWFQPAHQRRGAGEPAILAALTRKLAREFGLDRDAVFVAGLSAGGAMAAILADVYPDTFSAAGIHSGLVRGAARDVISGMKAMRSGGVPDGVAPAVASRSRPVRRIIFQGASDSTIHPSNAALIVAAAVGDGTAPTRIGKRTVRGRGYARSQYAGPDGVVQTELWMIEGTGHAWSGGRAAGSFTDRKGPDASALMLRFFMAAPA